MMTILQAFNELLASLELTEAERDEAIRQHTYLREELQARMDVEDNFLSGSYKRRTAIRPLNDIDVFLVLRQTDELHPGLEPSKVLTKVKNVLEAIYPGKIARLQARSVNIAFTGTGIAYDIVPAFSEAADVYRIPDIDTNAWIRTNPKIHKEQSTAANEQAGTRLKPLLKAVKHANNVHADDGHKPARSFHLEVLSWKILTSPPESDLKGLVTLFEGLEQRMCDPCPDPAGFGLDIKPPLDRCRKAQKWAGEMLALARDADRLAGDGRTSEAHGKLYELFGQPWPEKGSPASTVAPAIITGVRGPDHSGSRFG
jgi:Second Messenger Oligonucleotide or Dinucleotide Synthetase domain